MAWDDLVRVELDSGAVVNAGRAFAEQHDLKIVEDEGPDGVPFGLHGRPIEPVYPASEFPVELRGQALNDALAAEGLSVAGKLAEKQQRLAEFRASQAGAGVPDGAAVEPGSGE